MIKGENHEKDAISPFITLSEQNHEKGAIGAVHPLRVGLTRSARAYVRVESLPTGDKGTQFTLLFTLSDRKDQTALFAYGGAVQPLLIVEARCSRHR